MPTFWKTGVCAGRRFNAPGWITGKSMSVLGNRYEVLGTAHLILPFEYQVPSRSEKASLVKSPIRAA
jgi:hypothetical protein